jgi:hypothetical protein
VIPGADRHIIVFAENGVTDWHARLGLAGVMPVENGISVQAVRLDRPAKCGDDIAQYTVKESDGVVDAGVYYANLMAYDRKTIQSRFSCLGLFSRSVRYSLPRHSGGRITRTIS